MKSLTLNHALPVIQAACEEVRNHRDYAFDNARREDVPRMVIQLTLSGAGFFEDQQGRRHVGPGKAMLFTHHENSCYGYPPDSRELYRLRFIAFTGRSLEPLFSALRQDFGSVVAVPERSEVRVLFDTLFDRFNQRRFRDGFEMAEVAFHLLTALYREQVSGTRLRDPVEYGYHLIRDCFREPLSVKTLAGQCGISREHFNREFTRRYRIPPATLLRQLRLDYAKGMLQTTSLPLADVAQASGFSSDNAFCRAYKQHYGTTPASQRYSG